MKIYSNVVVEICVKKRLTCSRITRFGCTWWPKILRPRF